MLPLIASIVTTLVANKLPGVANAVIDKGLDYVQEKLGVELKPEMSPEEIQKIRQEAVKHEEFLIEQANKNTADARDMQKIALQQDDKFSKQFVYWFAAGWSMFAAMYITLITFMTVSNDRVADTILGFLLGTIIATIINFFYGSSADSKKKTDVMAAELKKNAHDSSTK